MSNKDGMEYEQTGGKKPKVNVKLLNNTSTSEILAHLVYRHRVGLLITLSSVSIGYIVYDEFIKIFIS